MSDEWGGALGLWPLLVIRSGMVCRSWVGSRLDERLVILADELVPSKELRQSKDQSDLHDTFV